MSNPTQPMIRYIRNADKSPRGVTVAIVNPETKVVTYGYSLWNPVDKWDKRLGLKKAVARAHAERFNMPDVEDRHTAVLDSFKRLESRVAKYYKDISPDNARLQSFIEG